MINSRNLGERRELKENKEYCITEIMLHNGFGWFVCVKDRYYPVAYTQENEEVIQNAIRKHNLDNIRVIRREMKAIGNTFLILVNKGEK